MTRRCVRGRACIVLKPRVAGLETRSQVAPDQYTASSVWSRSAGSPPDVGRPFRWRPGKGVEQMAAQRQLARSRAYSPAARRLPIASRASRCLAKRQVESLRAGQRMPPCLVRQHAVIAQARRSSPDNDITVFEPQPRRPVRSLSSTASSESKSLRKRPRRTAANSALLFFRERRPIPS